MNRLLAPGVPRPAVQLLVSQRARLYASMQNRKNGLFDRDTNRHVEFRHGLSLEEAAAWNGDQARDQVGAALARTVAADTGFCVHLPVQL
jgi:hypothetical protein